MGRLDVRQTAPARAVVGFIVLMLAEAGLAVLVFGRSGAEHLTSYTSMPGMIGLAAQLIFAAFPVMQVRF